MRTFIRKSQIKFWEIINWGMTSSPLVRSVVRVGYPYYQQLKSNHEIVSLVMKSACSGFVFGIIMFLITLTWS